MLSAREGKSNGIVEIAKIGLKQSGEDKIDVPVIELDLYEAMSDREEAEAVDAFLPGALRFWLASKAAQAANKAESSQAGAAAGSAASQEGPFGTVVVPVKDTRAEFVFGEGSTVVTLDADLRTLRLKATAKGCGYTMRVRADRPDESDVIQFVKWFGQGAVVKVSMEKRQGVLPFNRSRSTGPELGQVVSGLWNGVEYAGILVGKSKGEAGDDWIEVDDFGNEQLVPLATIAGNINVGDEDARAEAVDAFEVACGGDEIQPSWLYLMPALGAVYLETAPKDGIWAVTDEIADAALKIAKAARESAPRAAQA